MRLSSVSTPVPTSAPPTGYESAQDARDSGWLGQVPPPTPPAPGCATSPSSPDTTFAVPELAPEPWKSDPVLPGTDPTLFG